MLDDLLVVIVPVYCSLKLDLHLLTTIARMPFTEDGRIDGMDRWTIRRRLRSEIIAAVIRDEMSHARDHEPIQILVKPSTVP